MSTSPENREVSSIKDEEKTKAQLIEEITFLRETLTTLKGAPSHSALPKDELATPPDPPDKPVIPERVLARWQTIVDLMARIAGVPAGLIMRVDPPQIEVFVSSESKGNPYETGERAHLNTGLYCETVMANRMPLLVSNALEDPDWEHNPDIELDMIFYLGYPLLWPDGQVFGTICVLDKKERPDLGEYRDLIAEFGKTVETELALVAEGTALKHAETSLRESEERFREITDTIKEIFWLFDPQEQRFIYVSPAYEKIMGRSAQRLYENYNEWRECIHPDDLNYAEESLKKVLGNGSATLREYRIIKPDGTVRWLSDKAFAIPDSQGHLVRITGVAEDITDRKLMEEALEQHRNNLEELLEKRSAELKKREKKLQAHFDNSPKAVGVSVKGTHTMVNKAYLELFGYADFAELKERSILDLIAPEARVEILEKVRLRAEGKPVPLEYETLGLRKDGSIFDMDVALSIYNVDGVDHTVANLQDITARKAAEKALRKNAERYRVFIEESTAHVFEFELHPPMATDIPEQEQIERLLGSVLVSANAVAAQRRGAESVEKILGLTLLELWGNERNLGEKNLRVFIENAYQYSMDETISKNLEGKTVWNIVNAFPVIEDGRLARFWGTSADITERKLAERNLIDAYGEIKKLKEQLEAENTYLREEMKNSRLHGDMVGRSRALRSVLAKAEQVAKTGSTVLILGETGTGKELMARAIHEMSDRKRKPLVTVNCAAIPGALVESELFGREKGAYTGALTRQIGRFEAANGGTIFLDEIGELSAEAQAKLLRVVQEGQFERLGSTKTTTVDVRVITATNRDIDKEVQQRHFREDLFFRLNVFSITIPPLRERQDDIEPLAWAFINEFSTKMGKQVETVSQATMKSLKEYPWPGNIRELRNVVERAMISCTGKTLKISLPSQPSSQQTVNDLTLDGVQRRHIETVLAMAKWRVRGAHGAAKMLGLNPSTLESRMTKLAIKRPESAHDIS